MSYSLVMTSSRSASGRSAKEGSISLIRLGLSIGTYARTNNKQKDAFQRRFLTLQEAGKRDDLLLVQVALPV